MMEADDLLCREEIDNPVLNVMLKQLVDDPMKYMGKTLITVARISNGMMDEDPVWHFVIEDCTERMRAEMPMCASSTHFDLWKDDTYCNVTCMLCMTATGELFLNVLHLRQVTDFNEITYHALCVFHEVVCNN